MVWVRGPWSVQCYLYDLVYARHSACKLSRCLVSSPMTSVVRPGRHSNVDERWVVLVNGHGALAVSLSTIAGQRALTQFARMDP